MRICTKVHNALTRANDTFPHIPKHPKIPRATMHTKTHPKNLKNVIITTKTPAPKTQTTQFTSKIYIKHLKINFYRLILSHYYSPVTQNAKTS
jgi:hypothetical protein